MDKGGHVAARRAIMATEKTPLAAGRWALVVRRPKRMAVSLCLAAQWQGLVHTRRSTYPSLAPARLGFRDESRGSTPRRTSSIAVSRRLTHASGPERHWRHSQGLPPTKARTERATSYASLIVNRGAGRSRRDGLSV